MLDLSFNFEMIVFIFLQFLHQSERIRTLLFTDDLAHWTFVSFQLYMVFIFEFQCFDLLFMNSFHFSYPILELIFLLPECLFKLNSMRSYVLLIFLILSSFFFNSGKFQFRKLFFMLRELTLYHLEPSCKLFLGWSNLRCKILNLLVPQLQSDLKFVVFLLLLRNVVVVSGCLDQLLCVQPVVSHLTDYYILFLYLCIKYYHFIESSSFTLILFMPQNLKRR